MMYYSEFSFLSPPPPRTNLDLGDVRTAADSISSREQTQLFSNIVDTLFFRTLRFFPKYLFINLLKHLEE